MTDSVKPWYVEYKPLIVWVVATITMTLAGAIGGWELKPVPPPVVERIEIEKPVLVSDNGTPPDAARFGWVKDQDQIDTNLDPAQTLHFSQTPAGMVALGDEDVFLYRIVRKVNNRGPPDKWYPNVDQGQVGSCVGCGSKHGADVVQATAIASGQAFQWKPVSAEVIYSMSRIDIGGGRIRGDGSVGRWACDALRLGAMAPMEKVGPHDLTQYSAARARQWGSTGVPAEVKAVAKNYPVKGAALVKTSADVKRALSQGYPVVVCSDQGFTMQRDAQGFGRAQGTWAHAMCFIAWRNDRPGALCLNSWGDRAHTGPVWPDDQPVAAFWVDERTVNRMVSQGDSFALSDVVGFPGRKVPDDWFIRAPRKARPLDLEFALAP